jgi:hypothetical protein
MSSLRELSLLVEELSVSAAEDQQLNNPDSEKFEILREWYIVLLIPPDHSSMSFFCLLLTCTCVVL